MASQNNFFALLGDDENDDPAVLVSRVASLKASDKSMEKPASKQQQQQQPQVPAKLPSRPLPPHEAVAQQYQSDGGMGRGARGARFGRGRGNFRGNRGRGREGTFQGDHTGFQDQNFDINRGDIYIQAGDKGFNGNSEAYGDSRKHDGEGGRSFDDERSRGWGRGRGRGSFFGTDGEISRSDFGRNGAGRGNEIKCDTDEHGNRGAVGDPVDLQGSAETRVMTEEGKVEEMTTAQPGDIEKDKAEKDPEMSLDEYEKALQERRKGLEAFKHEQRKVTIDKDFESMQLVDKKQDDATFLKLVSDPEKGKKKLFEKEEKVRKSVSINEFLKPAKGEGYYSRRGRGHGRGDRGGFRGGFSGDLSVNITEQTFTPSIEDPKQFPTLSGN